MIENIVKYILLINSIIYIICPIALVLRAKMQLNNNYIKLVIKK